MARLRMLLRAHLRAIRGGLAPRPAPSAERIHLTRQRIKQARALLRLLRPELTPGAYRNTDAVLRGAGRALQRARERIVILETLSVVGRERAYMRPAVRSIERHWRSHFRGLRAPEPDRARLLASRRQLAVVEQRLRDWPPAPDPERSSRQSLCRCYRRGRRAWKRALESRSDADAAWHTCRRHTKYLLYQLSYAAKLSAPLEKQRTLSRKLGTALGDAHDLIVLREALRRSGVTDSPAGAAMTDYLAERYARSQHRAQKIATRLYARSVPKFRRLLSAPTVRVADS